MNPIYRQNIINKASQNHYDLAIVGGGITGAGVARDAASRGLKVILFEAHDFSSGTSSRSSKLVHGGIRYLENLEFGLVHEALTERKILLKIAPHMVHPLRFLIPIYKSSRVGFLKMGLGMIAYDILSAFEAPKLHERLSSKEIEFKEPLLNQGELKGGFIYSDAFMEDDRLVIETLRSARNFGADVVNYVEVNKITETNEGVTIKVRDVLGKKECDVSATHVVSCVGPWTDLFAEKSLPRWKKSLRPTKGVHIIFPREKLDVKQAVVMAVETRIIFVIPRGEVTIVGTTDTDYAKDPSDVLVDEDDVNYLLKATNSYFPDVNLSHKDIISCYSGIRPLVDDGAQTEGKTSREHHIFEYSDKVTLVAGGKYTTYRSMALEIVDTVLAKFPFEQKMTLKTSQTEDILNSSATAEKIERGLLYSESLSEEMNLPLPLVKQAFLRRGEEGHEILQKMTRLKNPSMEERYWLAEAPFCIREEMCLNLIDFYWRRTPLFLFHKDNGLRFLPAIAKEFATHLKWSADETQKQIDAVLALSSKELKAIRR
ncbi:MAG: glycerol-3-phosphate dehydrogenase/oxidase [Bdellovibrionales bacterium]|nr:glycerol-3-phosphate dehydrogenase/oxidase [Bdellovibrionales bacterium]